MPALRRDDAEDLRRRREFILSEPALLLEFQEILIQSKKIAAVAPATGERLFRPCECVQLHAGVEAVGAPFEFMIEKELLERPDIRY